MCARHAMAYAHKHFQLGKFDDKETFIDEIAGYATHAFAPM